MKILAICGSPRRRGNSEILLDRLIKGARSAGADTEKVIIERLSIIPCKGCNRCHKNARCFIRDGMDSLYKKLLSADAIAISSPVHFGSLPAKLKAMIDRCQPVWVDKFMLRKRSSPKKKRRGVFISVSGHNRKSFFRNSREIIEIFYMILDVRLTKSLYVPSMEHPGDVLKDRGALKKAFQMGAALADEKAGQA